MSLDYQDGFLATISSAGGVLSIVVASRLTGRSWQATRPTIDEAVAVARRIATEQLPGDRTWRRRGRKRRR